MPYVGYKEDKTAAHPSGGSLVETRSLKASSLPLFLLQNLAPDRSPEQAPECPSERTCHLPPKCIFFNHLVAVYIQSPVPLTFAREMFWALSTTLYPI